MASIIFQDCVRVPDGIDGLESFREWLALPEFPERGRIDFVGSQIEIDMSPEEIFSHGRLKAELAFEIGRICREKIGGRPDLLHFVDGTRISEPRAGLSTEPDIVVISKARVREGELQLVESRPGRFTEIVGGPDIAVEIVSEASVDKDSVRLPAAHYTAGTLEYWLVDARTDNVRFEIYQRGENCFESSGSSGWQSSQVLGHEFRIEVERDEDGWREFHIETRAT